MKKPLHRGAGLKQDAGFRHDTLSRERRFVYRACGAGRIAALDHRESSAGKVFNRAAIRS